jgi:hypothetical protein
MAKHREAQPVLIKFKQFQGPTPEPEKVTLTPAQEGKVKYQVFGDGILRDTWIWFYPHQLDAKRAKYKALKQWLFGPLPDVSEYSVD